MTVAPRLLLVGGGGHCRSVLDVLETTPVRVAGIVDNNSELREVLGVSVLGKDDDLEELRSQYSTALVTVGQIESSDVRRLLFQRLRKLGYSLPVVCSTLAHVSPWARIGDGTVIMHFALINAGAQVGENSIINTRALVEHDVVVGDHCHISTGAVLNGGVNIGQGVFIGSGTLVREGVRIGDGCVVGMGSVIRHDVPAHTVIKGVA